MRLFIDDTLCYDHLFTDIPIGFSAEALKEPQELRQGSTLKLTIPSTPQTDAVLGSSKDLYVAERFNASPHRAVIEQQGVVLFEGNVHLAGISTNFPNGDSYILHIVSTSAEWADRAAKTLLKNCGIELNMELTTDNISESWEAEHDVRFLPVLRNRYQSEISDHTTTLIEHILNTDDYHPFISIAAIFETLFSDYTVHSDFLNSSEFKSLMLSGEYASPDTTRQKMLLDFFARRASAATATANSLGAVYASAGVVGAHSLGNIVDTADPSAIDSDGKMMIDTFTTGNLFGINEDGFISFRSPISASVGFLLHLEYLTAYRIKDRYQLQGFDTITAAPNLTIAFKIANTYVDYRDNLSGGMAYKLCIFDFLPGELYYLRITDAQSGALIETKVIENRMTEVVMPIGITPHCTLELMVGEKDESQCDWALYQGWVTEEGQTEVVTDIRIPPQQLNPGTELLFKHFRFAGAEAGMEITLSTACSLRPYFSTVPGYGSTVTFADIAHQRVWLIEVVEAICKMFNLMIFTDERRKEVIIEPVENFYTSKVWDWSEKIDYSHPVTLSDLGVGVAQSKEYRYLSADYATKRFNAENDTELGCWVAENPTYGAKMVAKQVVNPLFTTGVNATGVYSIAPSASLLQVGDSAEEGSMDEPFTTHIIRYEGLRPLPPTQNWGYPLFASQYPLAAFHFPGDEFTNGFTLCYEDRDGIEGLNRYFKDEIERIATRQRISATINLSPVEIEQLFISNGICPSVRDTFRLTINNSSSLYRLESIESYSADKQSAKCSFIRLAYD